MLASEAQVKQRVHHFIEIPPPEKISKGCAFSALIFYDHFVTTYSRTSE
jgi:hypothetical protein